MFNDRGPPLFPYDSEDFGVPAQSDASVMQ
jgi:hypothetical protein